MSTGGNLPKFRRPPLIEVVHGVQFKPLPMTIAHPGLFYTLVCDRYPLTQSVPPLPPVQETFDAATPALLQFGFAFQSELPRAWFWSQDDAMLIQLQQDRLLLNWRRGAAGAEYPHFEAVSAEFQRVYDVFETFIADQKLGTIEPNQCEMSYVNHLDQAALGSNRPAPATLLRLWKDSLGPEWEVPLEDLAFTARYVLRGDEGRPVGRLTATVATLFLPGSREHLLQLDLTARGFPGSAGLPGVLAFHQMAHEQLVRCFAAMTEPAAHKKWERWQ